MGYSAAIRKYGGRKQDEQLLVAFVFIHKQWRCPLNAFHGKSITRQKGLWF